MKLEGRLKKLEEFLPEPNSESISLSPEILSEYYNNAAEWTRDNNYPGIACGWFLLSDNERDMIPVATSSNNQGELSIQQLDAIIDITRKYEKFISRKNIDDPDIVKLSTPSTFDDNPYSIKVDFIRNRENKTIITNSTIFSWFYGYYINNLLEPHPKVLECFERYCGSRCAVNENDNSRYLTKSVVNLEPFDTGVIDTFEIRRMQIIESPNN